ncbi:hypothetical protein [Aridibaculum aurantiacum]|uniref:hypothetical protein n=1 Tax=Aridibaculum aurantiacum TaxID=2810307 RepID=UPI001A971F78|nr:hypothetical protein [Aridibaculum aurantiacum]
MADNTTLDTLYIVDGSDTNVRLAVSIQGDGQTSDMTIKLDDNPIVENLAGNFFQTVIGSNASLDRKKLSIVALVADTSKTTNFTGLTIHLKGGTISNDFVLSKTVDEEGKSADYLCLIEFFKP